MSANHVRLGEIEIPDDYFKLTEDQKKEICLELLDNMLRVINKRIRPEINHIHFLEKLLVSSIQTNVENEKYEICQVLDDIRKLINE